MIAQLQELTDEQLVNKINSNQEVSGCLTELQNRHSGIFHQKVKPFSSIMEVKDLQENPMSFFYEVANQYDPSRAKFSTYLGQRTYWTCQDYAKNYRNDAEIHEGDAVDIPHLGRDEIYSYIQEHIEDEDDKNILTLSMEGYTLQEIADKLDNKFTYEWIRVRKKRTLARFKEILGEEIK